MLIDIYMKFLDILNRFQVTERTRFYDGHSSKGNNSKIQDLWFLCSACIIMLIVINMKFREDSWNHFQVIELTRQTPGENTMHISPYPKGGRHQYKIPSSSGREHIAFADLVGTGVPIQRGQY